MVQIKKGGSSSAHKLEAIIQNSSVEPRNKEENGSKYTSLIIGGVLVVSLALVIGYF